MEYKKQISPLNDSSVLMALNEETLFWLGQMDNCSLIEQKFTQCRFERIDLPQAEMQKATFHQSILNRVVLSLVNIHQSIFQSSTLCRVDLSHGKMTEVFFDNCLFNQVNFQSTVTQSVIFTNCDFSLCSFEGADLRGCYFKNSSLQGCTFNAFTRLPFSTLEAVKRGMVFKRNLKLVTNVEPEVTSTILAFPQTSVSSEKSDAMGNVINFLDYQTLESVADEGPESA